MRAQQNTGSSAWGALVLLITIVVGGGLIIGSVTRPGEWYAGLEKPWFNPPNWLFAPVWTTLYILIGVAGWRIWRVERSGSAMKLWWAQLALNFAWSPVFFGAKQIGLALLVIILLFATTTAFMRSAARLDKIAVWLFAPYALWVAFAAILNGALLFLN
jgi:tryptophan-rich sensory protein